MLASITYLNEISNFEGFIQNVGSVETLQKPELLLTDLSYLYSQYSALKRYQFTVLNSDFTHAPLLYSLINPK